MATRTSSQDGVWNSTATWNGEAVPADTDVVNVNHNVTLDVDSAVRIGTITIASGKSLTLDTASKTLTCAQITGAGTLSVTAANCTISSNNTIDVATFNIPTGGTGLAVSCTGFTSANSTEITSASVNISCAGNVASAAFKIHGTGSATTPLEKTYAVVFDLSSTGKFTGGTGAAQMYGYVASVTGTSQPNMWTAALSEAANQSQPVVKVTGDVTDWMNITMGSISGTPAPRSCWVTRYAERSNGSAANSRYTIDSITYDAGTGVSTITLSTNLSATGTRGVGSIVVFEPRNIILASSGTAHIFSSLTNQITNGVWFRQSSAGSGRAVDGGTNHTATNASFYSYGNGLNAGVGHSANSATFSGNTNGINAGVGHSANSATFSGNNTAIYQGSGHSANSALCSGNSTGINQGSGHSANSATFSGNNQAIYGGSGHSANSATLSGNARTVEYSIVRLNSCTFSGSTTADLHTNREALLRNCTLGSAVPMAWGLISGGVYYSQSNRWKNDSIKDGGNAGARKCWTLGGRVESPHVDAEAAGSTYYGALGANYQGQMLFANSVHWAFLEDEYTLLAGVTYTFRCEAKQNTTGLTATPIFELVNKTSDTLDDGGTALQTVTMTDNTDWQVLTLTHTPAEDQNCWLRFRAKNATNYVHFAMWQVPPSGGGVIVIED